MRDKFYFLSFCTLIVSNALAQTCGTTNIALNKAVTASSQVQWHEGSTAVDQNPGTWWQSVMESGDAAYIYVDLIQSYSICKVNIAWGNNGKASNYSIDVSADAVNWSTLSNITGNMDNVNSIAVNGTGRYVRIKMTMRYYNWSSYELLDVEVYNAVVATGNVEASWMSSNTNIYSANTGNVGIGTTNPLAKLEVNGSYYLNRPAAMVDKLNTLGIPTGSHLGIAPTDLSSANNSYMLMSFPTTKSFRIGSTYDGNLGVGTYRDIEFGRYIGTPYLIIKDGGNVGIGTTNTGAFKLAVEGNIVARGIKVTQSNFADHVFYKSYRLRSLPELEKFISRNHHLPEVPSAAEVAKNGLSLGDNQVTLLKKIEELTLYIILLNKKLNAQKHKIKKLESKKTNSY